MVIAAVPLQGFFMLSPGSCKSIYSDPLSRYDSIWRIIGSYLDFGKWTCTGELKGEHIFFFFPVRLLLWRKIISEDIICRELWRLCEERMSGTPELLSCCSEHKQQTGLLLLDFDLVHCRMWLDYFWKCCKSVKVLKDAVGVQLWFPKQKNCFPETVLLFPTWQEHEAHL